jgi:hypothetical protein
MQLHGPQLLREPLPNSVVVSGLVRHEKANGVYEPFIIESKESGESGKEEEGGLLPIYYQKGSKKAYSLEFSRDALGCAWRLRNLHSPVLAFQAAALPCTTDGGADMFTRVTRASLPHERFDPTGAGAGADSGAGSGCVWLVLNGCDYEKPCDEEVSVKLYYPEADLPATLLDAVVAAQAQCEEFIRQKQIEVSETVSLFINYIVFPPFQCMSHDVPRDA